MGSCGCMNILQDTEIEFGSVKASGIEQEMCKRNDTNKYQNNDIESQFLENSRAIAGCPNIILVIIIFNSSISKKGLVLEHSLLKIQI